MKTTARVALLALLAFAVACSGKKSNQAPAASPKPEATPAPAATATPEPAPEPAPAAAAGAPAAGASSNERPVDVPIPNARRYEGALVGGQPTAEQLEQAKQAGYTTWILLQRDVEPGVKELRAAAERAGLSVVPIPIGGPGDLGKDNAERLASALADAKGPVMVTCGSGNRVGALFALKAYYVDGKPPAEALKEGVAAGLTHLEAKVRDILEHAAAGN